MPKPQIILGIDPGVGRTGVAVVENQGSKTRSLYYGCIETVPRSKLSKRLAIIYKELTQVIETYKPECICVEELFFAKNVTTALQVAHARGVVLLAAEQNSLALFEFKPVQVKQAVTGYGNAKKKQVQEMVKLLYGLEKIPQPDDAADALAVAWCGASAYSMLKMTQ